MKRILVVLVFLGLVLGGGGLSKWHEALVPRAGPLTVTDVMLDVLGEIRTFIAQQLWFEADIWHHAMEEHGIAWTQEADLLPLYRMITLLDPRLVDAYDVASYQLVMNFNRAPEGIKFLDEGLAHNPQSYTLHYSKAFLTYQLKRYAVAVGEAEAARALAVQLLEEAQRQVPPPSPEEMGQKSIDLLNAIRILAHSYRDLRDAPAERYYLQMWLRVRPDDPYPRRRLASLRH